MDTATLKIIIQAQDEATAKLRAISDSAKTMGADMLAIGGVITGFLGLSVKSAADAQEKMANVHATLRAMGSDTPEVTEAIQKAADATLALGFDNEDAALSITKFYQRTHDLKTAIELNNTAMDLSRAKHIDLNSAMVLVNQVLSGNGRVLKQYGINIKDTASPLEALAELQSQISGQAAAHSKTFEGAMQVFKQQSGELMEQIGTNLLPVLTKLLSILNTVITKVMNWAQAHPELAKQLTIVAAVVGVLFTAVGLLLTVIVPLTIALGALSLPIIGIIALVGLLAAGATLVVLNWGKIKDFFVNLWKDIVEIFKNAVDSIMGFLDPLVKTIDKIISGISNIASKVGGKISSTFSNAVNFITGKASGGPVNAGTPYIVGEAGPELFVPSGSGAIIPNNLTSSPVAVSVNISGTFYTEAEAGRRLGDQIAKIINRQLKLRSL